MPLYEVCHSIPLRRAQKDALAQFITHLHSTTFLTPSLFVNIRFTRPEPNGDFYCAGKPRTPNSPNRVLALVRVGPSRPKEMFDRLALTIQEKWDEVVNDKRYAGEVNGNAAMSEKELARSRKLHCVMFHPMLASIENGVIIPGAGNEGTWLKDNYAYFKKQVDVNDDDEFRDMLKEVEERADLRKLIQ